MYQQLIIPQKRLHKSTHLIQELRFVYAIEFDQYMEDHIHYHSDKAHRHYRDHFQYLNKTKKHFDQHKLLKIWNQEE